MGPVISVFVMILIISILAGLTFLFTSNLKTNVQDSASNLIRGSLTNSTTNEVVSETGAYALGIPVNSTSGCAMTITEVYNESGGAPISSGNYTVTGCFIFFAGAAVDEYNISLWNITGTFSGKNLASTSYQDINDTETSGAGVIDYLPLVFLAIIFGAILTIVLKIILPFINLGQQMGGQF